MQKSCVGKTIKLIKEIKEELNKWRSSVFVSKKNQYQDSVLLIFTCRFNAFLIKTPAGPFVDVIKLDLRFIQRDERA